MKTRNRFAWAICVVLTGMVFGFGCSENNTTTDDGAGGEARAEAGPLKKFTVEADGEMYNLGEGEYLVAMLSATCEHCQASVPNLNEIAASDLPPLVGLMEGSEEQIQEFREMTMPLFPTQGVKTLDFFQFIDTAPPRLIYDRDGHVVQGWDWKEIENMPSIEEVEQAIAQG